MDAGLCFEAKAFCSTEEKAGDVIVFSCFSAIFASRNVPVMDAGACFEAKGGEEKACEAGPGSLQGEDQSVEGCQASP